MCADSVPKPPQKVSAKVLGVLTLPREMNDAYFTQRTREMNGGSGSSCDGSGRRKRPRTGIVAGTNRSLLIAAGALAVASTSASAAELELIPPLQMQYTVQFSFL